MRPMHSIYRSLVVLLSVCVLTAFTESARPADNTSSSFVYLGTYTGGKSKGIYLSRLDNKTGALSVPELVAETPSPSFLALHPNKKFLYAVGEIGTFGGRPSGVVTAFAIDSATGKLTQLNQQPSGGGGPCHIALDETGKCVVVA